MRDQYLNGGLAGVAAKEASHFAEGHTSQMHVLCPLGVIDIPVTADISKRRAREAAGGWLAVPGLSFYLCEHVYFEN